MLRAAGFRLDVIYPADQPQTAIFDFEGRTVRLSKGNAPEIPKGLPPFQAGFVLERAGIAAGQGRAGMLYRDLIPGRLGGRYIASHITIREGGPVADWVHYHRVALQLIYVRRGWVRVVYEGQGQPFVMSEGDLVLQPPEIRHRVLESSQGLEVIEISAPALHETLADHELDLPTAEQRQKFFGGQKFFRHIAQERSWTQFRGAEAQEMGTLEATGGKAEVRTIRSGNARKLAFAPHDGELVFGFVLEGTARLDHRAGIQLGPADAFVIPPAEGWALDEMSGDLRLLQVTTARLDAA